VTLHARPLLAPALVRVARRRAARGELLAPHAVRPVYLRQPDAVLARERAAAAGSRSESAAAGRREPRA
jgi:hypothetical protein